MNYPLLFSFLDALHPTSARRPTVQFEFSFEYEPFHALPTMKSDSPAVARSIRNRNYFNFLDRVDFSRNIHSGM